PRLSRYAGRSSANGAVKDPVAGFGGDPRRPGAPCGRQTAGCSTAGSTVPPRRSARGSCRRSVCCRNSPAPGVVRARSGPAPQPFGGSPDRGSSTRGSFALLDLTLESVGATAETRFHCRNHGRVVSGEFPKLGADVLFEIESLCCPRVSVVWRHPVVQRSVERDCRLAIVNSAFRNVLRT